MGREEAFWDVGNVLFLDQHGSYRDVCFIVIKSTVHLRFSYVSYISQHNMFFLCVCVLFIYF